VLRKDAGAVGSAPQSGSARNTGPAVSVPRSTMPISFAICPLPLAARKLAADTRRNYRLPRRKALQKHCVMT
jgi:hypothetical protein